MKALKKDTLKNGDVFKISFLPRGDDDVPRYQWQTSFRKAKWITDDPTWSKDDYEWLKNEDGTNIEKK